MPNFRASAFAHLIQSEVCHQKSLKVRPLYRLQGNVLSLRSQDVKFVKDLILPINRRGSRYVGGSDKWLVLFSHACYSQASKLGLV